MVELVDIVGVISSGVVWMGGEVGGSVESCVVSVGIVSVKIDLVDSIEGGWVLSITGLVLPISTSVVSFGSELKKIVGAAVASVESGSGWMVDSMDSSVKCSVASALQSVVRPLSSMGGLGVMIDSGVDAVALAMGVDSGFCVSVMRVGRVSRAGCVGRLKKIYLKKRPTNFCTNRRNIP